MGKPPFDPAQVLRMELIAYLYRLTERHVEAYVNDNLSAKYSVGQSVGEKAPNQTILSVIQEWLIKRMKTAVFKRMLKDIVQMALESGVKFGAIQIVVSVQSVADVNTEKDLNRLKKKGKSPRDLDARCEQSINAK